MKLRAPKISRDTFSPAAQTAVYRERQKQRKLRSVVVTHIRKRRRKVDSSMRLRSVLLPRMQICNSPTTDRPPALRIAGSTCCFAVGRRHMCCEQMLQNFRTQKMKTYLRYIFKATIWVICASFKSGCNQPWLATTMNDTLENNNKACHPCFSVKLCCPKRYRQRGVGNKFRAKRSVYFSNENVFGQLRPPPTLLSALKIQRE